MFTILARVRTGREVEEALELLADTGDVRIELVVAEQIALDALAGRVADHAGRSADEHDRLVTRALQSRLHDQRHEVADVQARGGRVVAAVEGDRAFREQRRKARAIRDVGHETACVELVENLHGARSLTRSAAVIELDSAAV